MLAQSLRRSALYNNSTNSGSVLSQHWTRSIIAPLPIVDQHWQEGLKMAESFQPWCQNIGEQYDIGPTLAKTVGPTVWFRLLPDWVKHNELFTFMSFLTYVG